MSDAHSHDSDEHESGIKTPKQLIAVIAAAFIVPVVVIIMLTQFVGLQNKRAPGTESLSPEAVARRIHPVGEVKIEEGGGATGAARTGEEIYTATCAACHGSGVMNAPKFGDNAAWAPRIARGFASLMDSALHGKNAMPARGGGDYSDYEMARAVVYMTNKSGAHFPEPAAPAASGPAGASAPAAAASK